MSLKARGTQNVNMEGGMSVALNAQNTEKHFSHNIMIDNHFTRVYLGFTDNNYEEEAI
jgi:hypothetical protein